MSANRNLDHERMEREEWGRDAGGARVLYHGCSLSALTSIYARGLTPRSERASSGNWSHTIESNPHTIYLTNSYALHFAQNAAQGEEPGVVLEVDCENPGVLARLHADEDALEQAGRSYDSLPANWDMVQRTRWYRARAHRYPALPSLAALGTCGHRGAISPGAIKRVAVIEEKKMAELVVRGGIDPTIAILNYQCLGRDYRAFMHWLFNPGEKGWEKPSLAPFVEEMRKQARAQGVSEEEVALRFPPPLPHQPGIVIYPSLLDAVRAERADLFDYGGEKGAPVWP